MTRIRLTTMLLGTAVLAACTKNGVEPLGTPTAASTAYIRFYNFGVNDPGVNFYANDQKVTAISSVACVPPTDPKCTTTGIESTTGVAYGAVADGALYSALPAGQYTLAAKIAAATDNGLAVSSLATTLADGKEYSFYLSGIYNAAGKTADSFILDDAIPTTIDPTLTYVRFVNAISNSNPMTLYAKNETTGDSVLVGSSVAYKGASDYATMPPGTYDLTARYAGSNTAVIARTAVSFGPFRVTSITSRGDMTVTSTTATNRPQLDVTANR